MLPLLLGVASGPGVEMGWLRGLLKGDPIAERLNVTHETPGLLLTGVTTAEVVGPEFAVRFVPIEDVVGGDEDRVPDRNCRARRASATSQPGVLGGEVRPLRASGGFGGLREMRAQPLRDL